MNSHGLYLTVSRWLLKLSPLHPGSRQGREGPGEWEGIKASYLYNLASKTPLLLTPQMLF